MSFVHAVADQARRREHDEWRARNTSRRVLDALAITPEMTECERLLAIGAACPFYTWFEKSIWIEEVNARFYV